MIRASSRSARAGHVRLERLRDRRLELGVLDAEPVRVGGDHRQRSALGLEQDAGEDRAHLVARGGAGDAARSSRPAAPPAGVTRLALELGQAREVLGGQRAEVEARPAGGDLDVALLGAQLEPSPRPAAGCARRRRTGGPAAARCPPARRSRRSSVLVSASSMSVARSVSAALGGDDQDAAERRAGCRGSRRRGRRAAARRRGNRGRGKASSRSAHLPTWIRCI